ncbi:MAG: tRNA nucleotidyltransferase [Hyphomicrobium sp.]|jgi:tRNA nucleotidyltransferase (CCA-adding enzyme)
MDRKSAALPPELLPMQPGLEILHLAALVAEQEALENDSLDAGLEDLDTYTLHGVAPSEMWPELARGLMSSAPSVMIRSLRDCGALDIVLPEVDALFGVPQIADTPAEVDIGEHLLAALDEAACCKAPLEARFALLTMNVGKSDSPREHLPVHYRHSERGQLRIEAISARFAVPSPCRELALLALAECERIHRVSEVRAGPVAALLDRAGAFDNPARFKLLMTVCSCDYRAYGPRSGEAYPKAALLATALKVCAERDEAGFKGEDVEDVQAARAVAIAQAFGSQRWSSEQT